MTTSLLKQLERQASEAGNNHPEQILDEMGRRSTLSTTQIGKASEVRADEVGEQPLEPFAQLLIRGRDLFSKLPREEREGVYASLSTSESLISKMIRDSCAVTLQCAVRSHQVMILPLAS